MQKLANIKNDTTIVEVKNTNAVKGGCSCGDKRPPRNLLGNNQDNGGNNNSNGWGWGW